MITIDISKKLLSFELSIKLEIPNGSFIALSGASGSGKSTLLRILAGLESVHGEIVVDGKVWLDRDTRIAPQHREIGFVFQDYALFPNMTIEENLLFVNPDHTLAKHLLEITQLETLKRQYPDTLSGGQKQRVSLCRAMMRRPKLLLMDEPLSALDPNMREKLQREILALHKEFETTTILVSHDPSEIYRLSSRVVQLELGNIVADGSPKEILLGSKSSQKFSFEGEVLEIAQIDVMYVAIISIGQQLVEVVISSREASHLKVGDKIQVGTKAFAPSIRVIS